MCIPGGSNGLGRGYKANFDLSVLEEIEQRQNTLRRGAAPLDNKVRVYFAGKLGSDIGIRAPVRDAQGRYMDRIDYGAAYFRVGELEEYLAKAIPTKMSDRN